MTAAGENILEAKRQIRRVVDEALARLTPSHRRAASIAVAQRLASVPEVQAAGTLMTFLSLATEIDTWPIIRWAWQQGKRVLVPRIEIAPPDVPLARREMAAVLLRPAEVGGVAAHPDVRPGPLGILEVAAGEPVSPAEIDVIILPCQAVDRAGNRLGKGGGFFDRFLARPDVRAARIVVAFQEQIFDELPVASYDQPVDMVVTDGEVLVFGKGVRSGGEPPPGSDPGKGRDA